VNWLVWRQHRKQFLILGALLALLAALLIPTGIQFWHTYQQALADCAQNPATPSCSDLPSNLFQANFDQILFRFVPAAVLSLPIILGIFWGAPLLAGEYAEGTDSLAWTQSVSRRKWLTVKLAWVLVATAVLSGAFTILITWWSTTPNSLYLTRFHDLHFSSQGIVPVAYALFAVALDIMVGAWTRRIMVAAGLALSLYIGLALIAVPNVVRPHFMAPVTVTAPMGPDALDAKIPTGANWVLSQNIVDKNGKIYDRFNLNNMPAQCRALIQQASPGNIRVKTGAGNTIDACLNDAGYYQVAKYQPAGRYWDFQWIEASIYLGLTIIAIGATYWLVLRREA
jgi:ABC-type transport system involved in multi-copper enzyme maturation permease subunit